MPRSADIVKDWNRLGFWLMSHPEFFSQENRSTFDEMAIGELYLVDDPLNHMSVFRKISAEGAELVRTLVNDCDQCFETYNGVWKVPDEWAGIHNFDLDRGDEG